MVAYFGMKIKPPPCPPSFSENENGGGKKDSQEKYPANPIHPVFPNKNNIGKLDCELIKNRIYKIRILQILFILSFFMETGFQNARRLLQDW
jgi:hypothetical protein